MSTLIVQILTDAKAWPNEKAEEVAYSAGQNFDPWGTE